MSMYTQLLGCALDQHERPDTGPRAGDALAELLRCRSRFYLGACSPSQSGQVLGGVTDQLAYDVALVELATSLGIDCDLDRFDQPQHERHTLERALVARGVPLDDLDECWKPSQER